MSKVVSATWIDTPYLSFEHGPRAGFWRARLDCGKPPHHLALANKPREGDDARCVICRHGPELEKRRKRIEKMHGEGT